MVERRHGPRNVLTLNDHKWYRDLREEYPTDSECWPWLGSGQMRVTPSAAWSESKGKVNAVTLISVKRYIMEMKRDVEGDESLQQGVTGLAHPSSCVPRCVNPWHAIPDDSKTPTSSKLGSSRSVAVAPSAGKWSCQYVEGLWRNTRLQFDKELNALANGSKVVPADDTERALAFIGFPLEVADAAAMRRAVRDAARRDSLDPNWNDMLALSLESGVLIDLSLPMDRYLRVVEAEPWPVSLPSDYDVLVGMPTMTIAEYASATGQAGDLLVQANLESVAAREETWREWLASQSTAESVGS